MVYIILKIVELSLDPTLSEYRNILYIYIEWINETKKYTNRVLPTMGMLILSVYQSIDLSIIYLFMLKWYVCVSIYIIYKHLPIFQGFW